MKIQLGRRVSLSLSLSQSFRQLHASAGGGGHDDHGEETRLQVRLHLRPVAGESPAQIRDELRKTLGSLSSLNDSFQSKRFHVCSLTYGTVF